MGIKRLVVKRKTGILYRNAQAGLAREVAIGSDEQAKLEASAAWSRVVRVTKKDTEGLEDIKGVGAATAKLLTDAGYESVKAVADSTPENIAKDGSVTEKQAEKIIASAKGL